MEVEKIPVIPEYRTNITLTEAETKILKYISGFSLTVSNAIIDYAVTRDPSQPNISISKVDIRDFLTDLRRSL